MILKELYKDLTKDKPKIYYTDKLLDILKGKFPKLFTALDKSELKYRVVRKEYSTFYFNIRCDITRSHIFFTILNFGEDCFLLDAESKILTENDLIIEIFETFFK